MRLPEEAEPVRNRLGEQSSDHGDFARAENPVES
jgi:hypothetical protein